MFVQAGDRFSRLIVTYEFLKVLFGEVGNIFGFGQQRFEQCRSASHRRSNTNDLGGRRHKTKKEPKEGTKCIERTQFTGAMISAFEYRG